MKNLSFIAFLTVILLTLNPSSLLFAMDPKMAEEVTEWIEKFVGGEQKETLGHHIETQSTENNKALESIVATVESSNHQNVSSGFHSSSFTPESRETSYVALSVPPTDDIFHFAGNHLVSTAEILRKVVLRSPLTTLCLAVSYLLPETLGSHFQVAAMSDANYGFAKHTGAYDLGRAYQAVGCGDTAITFQSAEDLYRRSTEGKVTGKTSEAYSWSLAGYSLRVKANYQAKAILAEEAGKATLAAGYREAAVILEQAADKFKLAAETKTAGKESAGISWNFEGESLQIKATYQAKASEAEERGNKNQAASYREAAAISEQAADQFRLAAKANFIGKKSEGNRWIDEGKSLQKKANFQAKITEEIETVETKFAEKEGKGNGLNIETTPQAGASYSVKVMEAQEIEKEILIASCREASTELWREGHSWHDAVKSFQAAKDYQAKASEAQEAGGAILAVGYRKAAQISQQAARQFELAAVAYATGKQDEGFRWDWAGKAFQSAADYQAKASEA